MAVLLLITAGAIWGDVPAPIINIVRQGGDPSESIAHISGFKAYPYRSFWLVEAYTNPETSKPVVLLQKITSDSITVDAKRCSLDPGIPADKYIFWDPILSSFSSGKEYFRDELGLRFPPRNTGRINYGAGEIPATNIDVCHYVGFAELHQYYTIQLYEGWEKRHTPNSTPQYVLFQTHETWMHPQFTIINSADNQYDRSVFYFLERRTKEDAKPKDKNSSNQSLLNNGAVVVATTRYYSGNSTDIVWEMQQDDLDDLLAYVPTLPNHVLELKDPNVRPTVYTHDSRKYVPQRYTVPAVVPVSYKLLTISMSILACGGTAILLALILLKRKSHS